MHRSVLLWIVVMANPVCGSCGPWISPCSAFQAADVVGIVRLDEARNPTRHQTQSSGVILKRYKGSLEPGSPIHFFVGGVCYDAPSQTGATYVVYAKRLQNGRYSTDCTRTHVVGEFPRDVEFLERFSSRMWAAPFFAPLGCIEIRMPLAIRSLWMRMLE